MSQLTFNAPETTTGFVVQILCNDTRKVIASRPASPAVGSLFLRQVADDLIAESSDPRDCFVVEREKFLEDADHHPGHVIDIYSAIY
jgi:hypothetical protein